MPITDLIPFRPKRSLAIRRENDQPRALMMRDFDRWFDSFFERPWSLMPWRLFDEEWETFTPSVDVKETDKKVIITAELPGLDEKDIEITVSGDSLILRGEKRQEEEEKGEDYYRMERRYGSFQRVIPLPCEVEVDKADATFRKGVLTINLPKTPAAQSARKIIPIKSS
ncbi:MAG: Hsp20/alpha crystallin family protein [Chloroflexota bacterium]|nr:MAG: molecular chaperone Hsp20 [Bellilinea sp.]